MIVYFHDSESHWTDTYLTPGYLFYWFSLSWYLGWQTTAWPGETIHHYHKPRDKSELDGAKVQIIYRRSESITSEIFSIYICSYGWIWFSAKQWKWLDFPVKTIKGGAERMRVTACRKSCCLHRPTQHCSASVSSLDHLSEIGRGGDVVFTHSQECLLTFPPLS